MRKLLLLFLFCTVLTFKESFAEEWKVNITGSFVQQSVLSVRMTKPTNSGKVKCTLVFRGVHISYAAFDVRYYSGDKRVGADIIIVRDLNSGEPLQETLYVPTDEHITRVDFVGRVKT